MRFWGILAVSALAIAGTAFFSRRRMRGNLFQNLAEMGRAWTNRFNLWQPMNINSWAKRGRRIIRNMNWT